MTTARARPRIGFPLLAGLLLHACAFARADGFQSLDDFDYAIGWRPHDVDCTVTRVADARLARQGKACLKLKFRVAPEDVGKKHWLIAARNDLRFTPPRSLRVWMRASGACPLFLSLRDEAGVEAIWPLRPAKRNEWERFALRPERAEWVSLVGRGRRAFGKPIVRVALFVRCEAVKKPGRYEFLVNGLEAAWSGASIPAPRPAKLIHSMDALAGVRAQGCDARVESGRGVQGRGCLKVVWRVRGAEQGPRWMSVVFAGRPFAVPRAISFWIRPEERALPLSLIMDDADGTRIVRRLPKLRSRRWNFVRLPLDESAKWLPAAQAKRPFANVWADSPIVRVYLTLDRDAVEEPGNYACYLDALRAEYEADIFPADAVRGAGRLMEKRVFSEGESRAGRFAFSLPRPGRVTAELAVSKRDGGSEFAARRTWPAAAGRNEGAFELSASALPPGDYSAAVRVVDAEDKVVFQETRPIRRVAPDERMKGFLPRFAALQSKLAALEKRIARLEARGASPAYLYVSRATLRRFLRVSKQFGYEGKFDRVERHLRFLDALAARSLREAERACAHPQRVRTVSREDFRSFEIRGGNLYAGGRPAVLIGPMGIREDAAQIPEFGFNCANSWDGWPNCMRAVLPAPGRVDLRGVERLRRSWLRARRWGVVLAFCPALRFPFWAYDKYPDTAGYGPVQAGATRGWRHIPAPKLCGTTFWRFCMEAPNTKRLVREYYAALLPKLAELPAPRIYWLMNEPAYRSRTPKYLELFHKNLARKYGDVSKLNAAWGARFESFDRVPFPPRGNKAARFDWLDFHQRQVAAWFEWLRGEVRSFDPHALTANKPTQACLFQPKNGVDMEAQARAFDFAGCDTYRDYAADGEFVLDTLGRGVWRGLSVMAFDFFKSVAPDKPIADTEYHFAHSITVKEYPENYVRAAFWQSFLHGMRLCCWWVYRREYRENSMVQYPPFARPRVTWALGATALDLRRLAEYVSLFPPKRVEVALLYSRSSVFLEPERCLDEMLTAYRALFFLDAPVGFVTERMIAEGALKDRSRRPKLLVVAGARYAPEAVVEAIAAYAREGGCVALVGRGAFAFDEHARPRRANALRGGSVRRLPREWSEKLSRRFDALFTECGVTRPVRVLDADGGNAWGVESRTVVRNGRPVTYLLNMRSEPVAVRLKGFPAGARLRDLISGETWSEPRMVLKPLAVLLLELDRSARK